MACTPVLRSGVGAPRPIPARAGSASRSRETGDGRIRSAGRVIRPQPGAAPTEPAHGAGPGPRTAPRIGHAPAEPPHCGPRTARSPPLRPLADHHRRDPVPTNDLQPVGPFCPERKRRSRERVRPRPRRNRGRFRVFKSAPGARAAENVAAAQHTCALPETRFPVRFPVARSSRLRRPTGNGMSSSTRSSAARAPGPRGRRSLRPFPVPQARENPASIRKPLKSLRSIPKGQDLS